MIEILHCDPKDQGNVQALILAGLKEYWGFIDENKNTDLKEIAVPYQKRTFSQEHAIAF